MRPSFIKKAHRLALILLISLMMTTSLIGCEENLNTKKDLVDTKVSSELKNDTKEELVDNKTSSELEKDIKKLTAENIPNKAMQLIKIYDTYCIGTDIPSSEPTFDSSVCSLGFAYLKENNIISKYEHVNDDGIVDSYDITYGELYDISDFLFSVNIPKLDNVTRNKKMSYSSDSYKNEKDLTFYSAEELPNGNLKIVFFKVWNSKPLNNVVYTLTKTVAKDIPEMLKNNFVENETMYQIESVKNNQFISNEFPQTVEINSVDDLIKMSKDISENGAFRSAYNYKLNADLDLTNVDFSPIGENESLLDEVAVFNSKIGFDSTFDGQNHTISNLDIMAKPNNNSNHPLLRLGLFNFISKNGVVKNLNMKNCVLSDNGVYSSVGIIAGKCEGQIINCHVQGKISGFGYMGGIAGQLSGLITNCDVVEQDNSTQIADCTANVDISATNSIGGLVGSVSFGKIINCSVNGTVKSKKVNFGGIEYPPSSIGGFVGVCNNALIKNCESSVSLQIKDTGSYIGAFAGNINQSKAENCTYDASKADKWDIIDVIEYKNATDYTGYDIKAK